jgi:hypothetical protein
MNKNVKKLPKNNMGSDETKEVLHLHQPIWYQHDADDIDFIDRIS